MTRLTAFRWMGAAVAVLSAAGGYRATTVSRRLAGREYAGRTATSAAAYLVAVTPVSRTGGIEPANLLKRARLLATLPEWAPDVEVYLGTAPLVRPTDPPLPLATLAGVSARGRALWTGTSALAPIPAPPDGHVIGAVEVRPHLPPDASTPWLVGLALVAAAAGAVTAARLRRRGWGWWLGIYALTALAFGGLAVGAANTSRRTATVRWLRETAVLIEDAGSRLPRTPSGALARTFKPLAADGELVVDTSSDPVLERALAATRPEAPLPIWLGGGRWLSLRPASGDWMAAARQAAAGAAAALGVLALIALSWGARDRARPGQVEEAVSAWMFLAPAGVHLAALTVAPLGVLVYVALHHWELISGAGAFVGAANLVDVASRPETWAVLGRTALFTLHVPAAALVALALALAARRAPTALVRVLLIAPPFASVAAIALAWKTGLATWGWLDHPGTAFWTLTGIAAVLQIGYQVPAFLAGLDRIPGVLWDAAALDGAGAWSRFRRVTEPQLRPVTLSILVTGVVVAVQAFTLAYVTGPDAPALAALHLYRVGWGAGRLDLAAALAVLIAVLLAAVVALQFRIWGRGVTDEP